MPLTRSVQRRSQQIRQQIATRTEKDYYHCPRCQKLFSQYHGAHKCHIKSCIAKFKAQAQEESLSKAEWIETPTPEPYTPVLTGEEMNAEDFGSGV